MTEFIVLLVETVWTAAVDDKTMGSYPRTPLCVPWKKTLGFVPNDLTSYTSMHDQ